MSCGLSVLPASIQDNSLHPTASIPSHCVILACVNSKYACMLVMANQKCCTDGEEAADAGPLPLLMLLLCRSAPADLCRPGLTGLRSLPEIPTGCTTAHAARCSRLL